MHCNIFIANEFYTKYIQWRYPFAFIILLNLIFFFVFIVTLIPHANGVIIFDFYFVFFFSFFDSIFHCQSLFVLSSTVSMFLFNIPFLPKLMWLYYHDVTIVEGLLMCSWFTQMPNRQHYILQLQNVCVENV